MMRCENPLSTVAPAAKTRDLIAPVAGSDRAEKPIDQVGNLERLDDVGKLRPFLTA